MFSLYNSSPQCYWCFFTLTLLCLVISFAKNTVILYKIVLKTLMWQRMEVVALRKLLVLLWPDNPLIVARNRVKWWSTGLFPLLRSFLETSVSCLKISSLCVQTLFRFCSSVRNVYHHCEKRRHVCSYTANVTSVCSFASGPEGCFIKESLKKSRACCEMSVLNERTKGTEPGSVYFRKSRQGKYLTNTDKHI